MKWKKMAKRLAAELNGELVPDVQGAEPALYLHFNDYFIGGSPGVEKTGEIWGSKPYSHNGWEDLNAPWNVAALARIIRANCV